MQLKFNMEPTFLEVSFIILVLFTLLVLVKCILMYKTNNLLSLQLSEATALSGKTNRTSTGIDDGHNSSISFKKSIDSAELTTKFQRSRLKATHGNSCEVDTFYVPEKYSYIRSLLEKGLSPDEIASVLSLSAQETEQIVALTMIGSQKANI